MTISVNKCPYCSNEDCKVALKVANPEKDIYAKLIGADFPSSINYLMCNACGLTFRDQILSEEESVNLYSNHYRTHILKNMSADQYFDSIVNLAADSSELDSKIANLKSLLKNFDIRKGVDIGCGVGAFIHKLQAAIPLLVMDGVEPTPEFALVAAKRNNSSVKNQSYDGFCLREYGLVTLVHVLEHTQAPWRFIRLVSENMKSGAYPYLETPSIEDMVVLGPDHDRFISPHNYLFSKEFISDGLINAGLSPLNVSYAITKRGKVDLRALAIKV